MTQIYISKLRLNTIIGVYPEERVIPQPIVLDIKLTVDLDRACQSDDIADAVDYDVLIKQLQQWVIHKHFHLIEALATYLANQILAHFPVKSVQVKLCKFPVGLPVEYIAVVISVPDQKT